MAQIKSFAPVCDEFSKTLILGSMPGVKSLQLDQYYAHPQNAFWPILLQLINSEPNCGYEKRIELLKQHGIALWDVLYSCERPGSLDNSILATSARANDFHGLFAKFHNIKRVFFNGAYAEKAYQKYVLPNLSPNYRNLSLFRLPSTSPAHASLSFLEKLEAWRRALIGD